MDRSTQGAMAKNKGEDMCAICLDSMGLPSSLATLDPCGHSFHHKCLRTWRREGANCSTCPACRAPLVDINLEEAVPPRLRPFKHTRPCCAFRMRETNPRKLFFPLQKLEEVDANSHFRNIFLYFEGEGSVLTLTAHSDEDFWSWMHILELYIAVPADFRRHQRN